MNGKPSQGKGKPTNEQETSNHISRTLGESNGQAVLTINRIVKLMAQKLP